MNKGGILKIQLHRLISIKCFRKQRNKFCLYVQKTHNKLFGENVYANAN